MPGTRYSCDETSCELGRGRVHDLGRRVLVGELLAEDRRTEARRIDDRVARTGRRDGAYARRRARPGHA